MAKPTPTAKPAAKKPIRLARTTGVPTRVITRGRKWAPQEDLYHWILTRSWPQFFLFVGATFFSLNALFALAYVLAPGAIANLPAGSFEDAFYFSVQTLATIGYGVMSPATRTGHILVAVEALTGMLSMALMTGLTFAKFTRPTARVLFAEKVTLTPRAGVPHLMFRMANWRGNQMIDVQLKVIVLCTEKTPEGETIRMPVEVKLVRDRTMLFMLTWMPMHRIDETSPFFGPGALERLRAQNTDIFLSLTGYDETIAQTVHVRHAYKLDDIVPDVRFADVLESLDDGTRVLNYEHFHDLLPIETLAPRPGPAPEHAAKLVDSSDVASKLPDLDVPDAPRDDAAFEDAAFEDAGLEGEAGRGGPSAETLN